MKFKVTAPDGTETEYTLADFTKGEDGKYTLTLNNVAAGKYNVEETTYDIAGNAVTVKYSVNGGDVAEGSKTDVDVSKNNTSTVDFEDNYTARPGTLVITKTIKGDVTDEEAEGALKFKVTAPSGDAKTYTLKDFTKGEDGKYTLTLKNVAAGKYTVEETTYDIAGNAVTVKYSVNGGDTTEGSKADVDVSKNETSTVDFEDSYTAKPGKLVITKTIKGDVTAEEAEGALEFKVTAPSGDAKTYTLKDFTRGEDGKYTLTLNNVAAGKYNVEETTYDIEGNAVTVKYSVNGGDATEGSKTDVDVSKNNTSTVDFEDNYTARPGKLVITKTIKGDVTAEEAEGTLKFKVTAPSGDTKEYTLANFTKEKDGKYTLTLENVEAGNYTVEETTYDITGNAVTVKYSVNGGDATEGSKTDVDVSKNNTSTVDFEDSYTAKPGKLVITKTIKGDVTAEEAEGALKFKVTAPDGTETEYTLADFTKGEDGKYTLTLNNVAAGKYNVEETTYDIAGNAVTVKYSVNGGDVAEGSKTDVEVSKDGTSTVAFEDVYTKKSEKTGTHTSNSTPASKARISESNQTSTVQTGDEATVKEYMGLLFAGIAIVFFGYSGRRRKKH